MMSQWLPRAAQAGMRCALLMIDIDRFKWVNEALGPRIDDEMLKAVAQRLRNCLRGADGSGPGRGPGADDRIARLGGDEFAVLLVDIGEPAQAHQVAQRIVASLSQPVIVQGHELTVCPSVGMAMTPDDGDDMTTLLRNASTAMHAARQDDRNPIRFYDSAMSAEIVRRHTIETELRHAVEHGELQVHYQPKVDLRSLSVVGAEALLRWAHPARGLIGAAEFIPIAQASGLIVPITRWVIRQVCDQLSAWHARGVDTGPVSINLDAASLEGGDLAAHVDSAIAQAGLLPGMIEFEVTESTLMRNLERVGHTLEALRAIGVKLSIDDFGTGYSSLAYLKRLPVDVLKIDRMFIKDAATEASDAALVTAIIAMGRSLKLQLVAEGVETWAQADFLARGGCHLVQGFLFAKALPAEDFAALVRAGLPAREPQRPAA
ncbi:MAG: bifunctional diguanylate cyclase/phosphodiesterase, partial [Burkholderiales bacterium]|nr:bifunctional diguanylate cyclase/phosphodiesterase [Burkholderiales bacterium]